MNKPEVKKEGAFHFASGSGQQPQMRSSSDSGGHGGHSRNSFRRPDNKDHYSRTIVPKYTLKGDNATLAGFISDSAESYCANDLEANIERISGYVADKYEKGPNIHLAVLKLEKPTFTPPADPIGEYRSVLKIWEKEIDLHVKQKRQIDINIRKMYALVIRQCTKSLKVKL